MERTLFNARTVADIEFCLDRGDNIEDIRGTRQKTPFIHYCRYGNIDIVFTLIKRGCNINYRDRFKRTGLNYICWFGHYDLLVRLLQIPQLHESINPINPKFRPPLMDCCAGGHSDIFDVLIENGADVNVTRKYEGSPLHTAVFHGNGYIVRKLLDNGANLNVLNNRGNTCIHFLHLSLECLDILLCYGAFTLIDKQNDSGCTPLHFAVVGRSLDIVQRLLDCGAHTNIPHDGGNTPLMTARSIYDDGDVMATIITLLEQKSN